MSTIAETTADDRCDQRARPGDGKRTQCTHILRIVVLRNDKLTAARLRRASNESHGLTDEELKIGEALLKEMAAPLPSDPTAKRQKNMFKELKPTDIVVIGQEAASVRVDDDQNHAGHARMPPTLRLMAHNDRHKDTGIRVWTNSDGSNTNATRSSR